MKPWLKMLIGWSIGSIGGIAAVFVVMYYVEPDMMGEWAVLGPIMAVVTLIIMLRQLRKQRRQSN